MIEGAVVWITGLPSAGKSTLARRLRERLSAISHPSLILDGDEVREALVPRPGYDDEARAAFYATLGHLAVLVARQGLVAIVAATTHRRAWRDQARQRVARFVEVHVTTPVEECARRDDKGLWSRAAEGELPSLPGAGVGYEAPAAPEVVAAGGIDDAAIARIVGMVASPR